MSDLQWLRDALGNHKHLHAFSAARLRRINSDSHQVFELVSDSLHAALKAHRNITSRFIDFDAEAKNEAIAIRLDLAPKALFCDQNFKLIQWVENSEPLNLCRLDANTKIDLVVDTLATLHQSTPPFTDTITVKQAVKWNLSMAANDKMESSYWQHTLDWLESVEDDLPRVNCHGDLVAENILIQNHNGKTQAVLIDFEYSHVSVPYWDLANLVLAADLGRDAQQYLLDRYATTINPDLFQPSKELFERFIEIIRGVNQLWYANNPL